MRLRKDVKKGQNHQLTLPVLEDGVRGDEDDEGHIRPMKARECTGYE